jgi:protein-tyrosine kinase
MNKTIGSFLPAPALELDATSQFSVKQESSLSSLPNEVSLQEAVEDIATERIVSLRNSALLQPSQLDQEQRMAAEQYKIIRTKILHHQKKPKWILVSSASSGDGKTVTAINFAGSLALRSDLSVLLIDGDMRKSSIASYLGIDSTPGLAEVLSGDLPLESALLRTAQFPNLFVLPAGAAGLRAAELLDSPKWRALLVQLRARFNYIICDAPPIATVADYEILEQGCDGVMVVARPDHTPRATYLKALETINKQKLLGVVLNCVEDWWLWRTPAYGYCRGDLSAKG